MIAVLLPLSGRYAAIGAELRAAIELAPADAVKWKFLDTRGEPDGATAAVDAAVKAGAIAILGPVGDARGHRRGARGRAPRRADRRCSRPADGADPSAGVFRLVASPADEGRAVAELAQADSFPTVAVFAPRDDIGAEAADAFVTEARRRGLQVAAEGTYDPTGGDLEPDVKAFLNLVPAKNPRLAEHLAQEPEAGPGRRSRPTSRSRCSTSPIATTAPRWSPRSCRTSTSSCAPRSSPIRPSSPASTAGTSRRSSSSSAAPAGTTRACRSAAATRCRAR